MRKLFVTTTVLAGLLAPALAYAATAEGVVKSYDSKSHIVTLEDGSRFTVSREARLEHGNMELKPGEKVSFTYKTLKNGQELVTKYKIAS